MRVVVIGAGAAGLIAAGKASEKADVTLIEKNLRGGMKIGITGKGRCNLTNNADISDFIEQYPRNGSFLYSALYNFTNRDIINLVERFGVKTTVERGGRVFPESGRATDVAEALRKYAMSNGAVLIQGTVKSLITENGEIKGVRTNKGKISADKVIICTGGKSYPKTGSTGDGYALAE